jgi:hypothetical protein
MPWRCPACQSQIRHNEFEETPRVGRVYRCHICRLELVVDSATGRLTAAPIADDEERSRPTR